MIREVDLMNLKIISYFKKSNTTSIILSVVSYIIAPSYKISKFLLKIIKDYINLCFFRQQYKELI